MSCPSLVAWLREEHLKVEALANELRQTVAVVPRVATPVGLEALRDRFGKFRAHLIKHMSMEEDGGYMVPVLSRRPGLAGRVGRLQHQHGQVRRLLDDIHGLLNDMTPEDLILAQDCSRRIDHLLDIIHQHEEAENDLVEFVFTDDIGTTD